MPSRIALGALALFATGCMTYRGPLGVEEAIERKAQVELHRELGIKLGPLSTKFAASFVHHSDGDQDFLRDVSGIALTVFEVTRHKDAPAGRITAKDVGVEGWHPVLENRSEDEQLLLLAKPGNGEIREMMLVSIESDEVVVIRLKGHLDRLIARTLAGADQDGARGARAAVMVSP
jgi:hypothetical protein